VLPIRKEFSPLHDRPASQSRLPCNAAVVFDLGDVLLDWNLPYLHRRRFDNNAAMEHFLSVVCSNEWNERQPSRAEIEGEDLDRYSRHSSVSLLV